MISYLPDVYINSILYDINENSNDSNVNNYNISKDYNSNSNKNMQSIPLRFGIAYNLKFNDKGYIHLCFLQLLSLLFIHYVIILLCRLPMSEPIDIKDNHDTNLHSLYTPYRIEYDINTTSTGNNNSENRVKTSFDYKKYGNSNNLSSLYPIPYASPILFKLKANMTKSSNNNYVHLKYSSQSN